jgi:hypothetical protein
MGIAEAGGLRCLFQEAESVSGIGTQVGREAFQRNQPFELSVLGAIHLAHTAFSQ